MAAFSYPPITTLDCPVVRRNNSHHVHLDNQCFDSSGITPSPYSIPKAGRLCNFSSSHPRGDRNSFLGRILRTIQWQRSRTIVRVEHDNGLANGTALWLGAQCLSIYLAQLYGTKHRIPSQQQQRRPRVIELGSGIGLSAYVPGPPCSLASINS